MAEPWAEYSVVLKIRKLLIFRDAKNVKNDEIAANWNVSATRTFQPARQFREGRSPSSATALSFQLTLACRLPTPQNSGFAD
jgi:hypothetical protein